MNPPQTISLMRYQGPDDTFAMADHADHIHIGWRPLHSAGGRPADQVLRPKQWITLINRLGEIENPVVDERR